MVILVVGRLTRFVVEAQDEEFDETELAVELGVSELNWLLRLELLLLVEVVYEDGEIALWRCKSIWLTGAPCVVVTEMGPLACCAAPGPMKL